MIFSQKINLFHRLKAIFSEGFWRQRNAIKANSKKATAPVHSFIVNQIENHKALKIWFCD